MSTFINKPILGTALLFAALSSPSNAIAQMPPFAELNTSAKNPDVGFRVVPAATCVTARSEENAWMMTNACSSPVVVVYCLQIARPANEQQAATVRNTSCSGGKLNIAYIRAGQKIGVRGISPQGADTPIWTNDISSVSLAARQGTDTRERYPAHIDSFYRIERSGSSVTASCLQPVPKSSWKNERVVGWPLASGEPFDWLKDPALKIRITD